MNGWVSASGGKWHRATVPEPGARDPETGEYDFGRKESTACGLSFVPLNVTWNGDEPPTNEHYKCQRPGCREAA